MDEIIKEKKEVKEPKKSTKSVDKDELFTGTYIRAVGRRKSATADVRLYQNGSGVIMVNDKKLNDYFSSILAMIATQSLKLAGRMKDYNFSIQINGGGTSGQAEAMRHGIARALIMLDPELKPSMRAKGYITRDPRMVERKKPGLKKARRAPQWSKR